MLDSALTLKALAGESDRSMNREVTYRLVLSLVYHPGRLASHQIDELIKKYQVSSVEILTDGAAV